MGEFGATILFAGSFQGTTQTLSLAVYSLFDANLDQAISIGVLIRTQSDKHDDPALAEAANVGLRAAPSDVRVLAPGPRPTTVAPEGAPTAVAAIR